MGSRHYGIARLCEIEKEMTVISMENKAFKAPFNEPGPTDPQWVLLSKTTPRLNVVLLSQYHRLLRPGKCPDIDLQRQMLVL
jgi:hypothetical protein